MCWELGCSAVFPFCSVYYLIWFPWRLTLIFTCLQNMDTVSKAETTSYPSLTHKTGIIWTLLNLFSAGFYFLQKWWRSSPLIDQCMKCSPKAFSNTFLREHSGSWASLYGGYTPSCSALMWLFLGYKLEYLGDFKATQGKAFGKLTFFRWQLSRDSLVFSIQVLGCLALA